MDVTDAGDTRITALPEPQQAVKGAGKAVPAQESGSSTNSGAAKLEPFLLLAKSTRGAAAAALVQQATAAPGVFVFGELLACPSIDELKDGQHKASHDLLSLFAYGTWRDYQHNAAAYPKLSQAQETKLKLLTILTLASIDRMIPYQVLLEHLQLPSVPALEDLLIEGFYSGLFTGRLDQRDSVVEISSGIGRDVRSDSTTLTTTTTSAATSGHSVASLLETISAFRSRVSLIVRSLDGHLSQLAAQSANTAKIEREHEARVRNLLDQVVDQATSGGGQSKDQQQQPGEQRKHAEGGRRTRATKGESEEGGDTTGMEVDGGPPQPDRSNRSSKTSSARARKRGRT